MMGEIGGYFELDQLINNPYHRNMIELNSGRNALIYLVKARKIKKIYLPSFLCDSVSDMLMKHSVEHEFYKIDKNLYPVFNIELYKNEYLYVVNYYGQLSDEKITNLKNKHDSIILDSTQSFFQRPICGVDTIYSCRKFFGVPDGAYLSTDKKLGEELEVDLSMSRMSHILGRFEGRASDYYKAFKENDKSFKELPLKKMSNLTRNFLGAIDYEKAKIIRNSNFMDLHRMLGTSNLLNVSIPDGPFAYPYYTKLGLSMRKKLSVKNIYIPILWPNVFKTNNNDSVEYDYAANILPLPCDQRYGSQNMIRIVNELMGG
jgi:hypothetical protein